MWKWQYFYVRKAYCAVTKEIASVLPGSLLKNKMWISISSFRHVLVCSRFFSSAGNEYRHERKSLRLFRQKALYCSWSLPLQPRWSECCGRHWRKFNKSSSRGRRHICGRCDLSKTLPNIKLYRWWFFMLSYRWPAKSLRLCQWRWVTCVWKLFSSTEHYSFVCKQRSSRQTTEQEKGILRSGILIGNPGW